MKNFTKIFMLAAFLFAGNFLQAQDAAGEPKDEPILPSVDDLLTEYYEVIGGVDAWKEISSMKITGSAEQMGMNFPITVTSMPPNMQRVDVDVQGQKVVEAFDGEVAWSVNPFMGSTEPVKKTEEEAAEAAKQMFEDELIDWKEKGHTVTVEGTEEVDGVETIKVKMVKANGDEIAYFFDPENYVPIMSRNYIAFGPMAGKAVDTYLSDYDEVDGLIVPFSIEQKMEGQTMMKMTAEKIEFNLPMEKEVFMMPEK